MMIALFFRRHYFGLGLCFFVLSSGGSYAQDFKMGYTPPATAGNPEYRNVVLEIEGVDRTNPSAPVSKGILLPKMTTAERDRITSAPSGLIVYVTDDVPGFYYNAEQNSRNSIRWERFLTGASNSLNGVYTITDSVLRFSTNVDKVSVNTLQNNTLELGKQGTGYIRIPSTMGPNVNQTGMVITDNNDFKAYTAALITLNSSNKGILIPRVTAFPTASSLPPLGLMVILVDQNHTLGGSGLYIQMSDNPLSPSWKKVTTAP